MALTRVITQLINPGCNRDPSCDTSLVARGSKRSHPLGNVVINTRAILAQHLLGTGPQFPLAHHLADHHQL